MHIAVKCGQLEMFQNILQREKIENLKINFGRNLFYLAWNYGHLKVAEILLKESESFCIDISPKSGQKLTFFHKACVEGNLNIAKLIIQKFSELNIDLNAKDRYEKTAFILTCEKGLSKIADLIVKLQWPCKST